MAAHHDARLKPLTDRQRGLLSLIQSLDPEFRYTITVNCHGNEPWQVEKVVEHGDPDPKTTAPPEDS